MYFASECCLEGFCFRLCGIITLCYGGDDTMGTFQALISILTSKLGKFQMNNNNDGA